MGLNWNRLKVEPAVALNDLKIFTTDYLDGLMREASVSPRLRQHRNLHGSFQEPCQRLFNALGRETYIRPHRHSVEQGAETLIAVRGTMVLVLFDDQGSINEFHYFGGGEQATRHSLSVGVEIPCGIWHTILAIDTENILLEVKAGPFNPKEPKEVARWAPEEGSECVSAYMQKMREQISSKT